MKTIDIIKPEEALKLKELGFDVKVNHYYLIFPSGSISGIQNSFYNLVNHNVFNHKASAPTFAEAFRWFRTKFMFSEYRVVWGASGFFHSCYIVYKEDDTIKIKYLEDAGISLEGLFMPKLFNTYEEAELEGLKNLITIYENQLAVQKEKEGNNITSTEETFLDSGGYQTGT